MKKKRSGQGPRKKTISKDDKLIENLAGVARQFIMGKGYRPMSESELFERLKLPEQHKDIFKKVIAKMLREGAIEKKDGRFAPPRSEADVVTGIIRVNPRGFGFVQPDSKSQYIQDIFIPKHLTLNAVDGDSVEVIVNLETVSDRGPEGKVITILNRARSHLAGTVRHIDPGGSVRVYAPLLGKSSKVILEPSSEHSFKIGDRIVMKVIEWGDKESECVCRFSHYIGNINDPGSDIGAAIEEFGLRDRFPVAALNEAKQFPTRVLAKDMEGREDLRDIECFTIDPDTAKDFDDAVFVKRDANGYHLSVHIADVTHYVKPGSHIDSEALQRCNSVYLPSKVLPMLPEELSNNLCSLKPAVNRLAVSVLMDFDIEGKLLDYKICRSVIKSRKRMTYKDAKKIIDGKVKSPYKKALDDMVDFCGVLKKRRYERGSIEFSLPELIVIVDENGEPTGTEYVEYDITHQLIEEFMLKANEVIAQHLSKKNKNITYRVHDEPAEENIKDFALLARAFGYDLPEKPSTEQLQKLFDEAQKSSFGPFLATSFIRRMRMAAYSPENIGHYGLALTHYCHFTSPIRRYADVVVHRILFGESDEYDEIEEVSNKFSDQERISSKAENSVILLKKLRLLKKMIKDDPYKEFEAVVTRIKPFGFFFEVLDIMIEGFQHIGDLEEDFYVYDEGAMQLKGRHTGRIYEPGKKISLILGEIDLVVLESKWYLVPEEPAAGEEKQKKSHKRPNRQKKRRK
jgi:ribonuclease R